MRYEHKESFSNDVYDFTALLDASFFSVTIDSASSNIHEIGIPTLKKAIPLCSLDRLI